MPKGHPYATETERAKARKASRDRWKAANPEKLARYSAGYFRERRLQRGYGLTREQYDRMLAAQDGCCAICRSTEPGRRLKHFCIDHDHVTGAVRGLLCHHCNLALGAFKDRSENLSRAIEYLAAASAREEMTQ